MMLDYDNERCVIFNYVPQHNNIKSQSDLQLGHKLIKFQE
jgi:hypothetical protein